MLTSSKEQVDIAATYDLGANSYVQKPVDFENFVATRPAQLGLYWTVLNQPAEGGPPTRVRSGRHGLAGVAYHRLP
jgi:hypothetical protein